MHGQNPSWASGEPTDRTARERSRCTVMTASVVIDGRADERECRAADVPAKQQSGRKEGDVFRALPGVKAAVCREGM